MQMNEKAIVRADDMKRPIPLYDFKAFGEAIKEARKKRGESRNKASSDLYISPRYLANIENKGQHPSLQVFYDLVTRYDISVDQFFFPDKSADRTTQRRQLDAMLDGMSEKGLRRTSQGQAGHRASFAPEQPSSLLRAEKSLSAR